MRVWWLALVMATLVGCGDDHPVNPDAPIDSPDGPAGEMVTEMVGPSGGTVELPGLQLMIPPGALTSDQTIAITKTDAPAPSGYTAASAIYHLAPEGLVFTQNVTVTLELASVASHTRVFWSKIGGSGFDDRGGTISGSSITAANTHFSDVFAGLLPVELAITPATADFGTIGVGTTSPGTVFTVENFGAQETGTLAATISGSGASAFAITQNTCTTLGTAESCATTVVCSPPTIGQKTATLTASDGTEMVSAALECNATSPPSIIVSPSSTSFGNVVVGAVSTNTTFTITNPGTTTTGLFTLATSGTDPTQFAISQDTCSGASLAPSASCTFAVRFTPTSAGNKSGSIVASATPGGTAAVAVTGVGIAPAQLSVTPSTLDFGTVTGGTVSNTQAFVVRNTGGVATAALGVTPTGSSRFVVTSDTCSTVALAPNATCSLQIRFEPTLPGAVAASFVIADSAGASTTLSVTGTGIPLESIVVTPSVVSFGSFVVGIGSPAHTVTITNPSGVPTGALGVASTGAHVADFAITHDGCTGIALAPAASCTIDVAFTATAPGTRTASVDVSGTPGGIVSVGLTGTGIAPSQLVATPPTRDFGSVGVGDPAQTTSFTVSNTGAAATAPIALTTTGSADFTVVSDACSGLALAPMATCSFGVRFAPTNIGMHTGEVTLAGGSGASVVVGVFGQGVTSEGILSTPGFHAFGSFLVGVTSPSRTFTITNNGIVATGAIATFTTGANAADFTITGDTCAGAMLAPAASCTIDVVFAPTARGARSATVTATASPGGTNSMAVQGIGLAPAHLVASPALHDFGSVAANASSAPLTITVTNDGDAPTAALGNIVLGGAQTEISVVSNGCAATSLAGGESCDVVVRFTPTAVGSYSGTLSIASSIGGTAEVTLAGTGIAPASLSISPAVVNFAARLVGSSSPPSLLTITNTGSVPTATLATAISGANPSDFAIQSDTCVGATLAPGDTCAIAIAFTPSDTGARIAGLDVTGAGDATASLAGTGLAPAQIIATPSVLAYGNLVLGDTGAFDLTITNLGGVPTGALATSLVGADSAHFSIGSDSCNGATLAANASCTLFVSFTPTALGTKSVDVRIAAAPGGTVVVAAIGTSIAPAHLAISPPLADFGSVVVGQASSPITFTVQNTGAVATGAVTRGLLGPDASQFSIEPASTCAGSALAPGASCTLVVRFQPTTAGAKSSSANVSASPGGAASANLAGTGLAPAQLQLSPASRDFGSVVVGEQSAPTLFTITNAGGVTSGVVDGVFLAPDGSQFIVDLALTTCGVTLAPGASCTTAVRFAPTSPGTKTSTARVSATPGGTVDAALAGTGIAAAALVMSPTLADFGAVVVGETSSPVSFTITNVGGVTSGVVDGVFLPPDNSQFIVDVALTTCGVTLAPSASCITAIRFAPTSTGTKTSTGHVSATPGGSVDAALTGTGIGSAVLAISPPFADFGSVTVGNTSAPVVFTVTNIGDSASGSLMGALADPTDFTVDIAASTCLFATLAPTASCTVTIRFAPASTGAKSTSASLTGSPGGTVAAALSGTGI